MSLNRDTIALAESTLLTTGAHDSPEQGMCMLEMAAYIAGEEFSDHPHCVCPTLAAFGRRWNDALDDQTRQRLKPYIPRMIGTRGDGNTERRGWICLDWLIRECTPAWLDLIESLKPKAQTLRALPEITDATTLVQARAALAAARDAAGDAARAAAGDAARDAARAAAWDEAGDATWAAAADAAADAAWAAAWDAARAAAWDEAGDAARERLVPTTKQLQESAFALLERMVSLPAHR